MVRRRSAPRIDSELVRGQHAEPVGESGQVALVAHPVQQPLGAERAGREDHLLGGETPCARRRRAWPR
ncbi:MAG: hypothetical protein WKF47_14885 [Geodermatophilaceae bacterium]